MRTEPLPYVLPAELSIYAVGELAPALRQWASGAEATLCLDARAVAEVDAAGMQLLLALHRQTARTQHTLHLLASDPLRAAAGSLGLGAWLQALEAPATLEACA